MNLSSLHIFVLNLVQLLVILSSLKKTLVKKIIILMAEMDSPQEKLIENTINATPFINPQGTLDLKAGKY